MRGTFERLSRLLARLRAAARAYDRRVLLRYFDIWQTRLHWIGLLSGLLCAVIVAWSVMVPVHFHDTVPVIDQIVYPLLIISAILMVLWTREQAGAILRFPTPSRRRILVSLCVRLACIAGLVAPPLVLSASFRWRTQQMMSGKDFVHVVGSVATAHEACRREIQLDRRTWSYACAGRYRLHPDFEMRCKFLTDSDGYYRSVPVFDLYFELTPYLKITHISNRFILGGGFPGLDVSRESTSNAEILADSVLRWFRVRCRHFYREDIGLSGDAVILALQQMELIWYFGYESTFPGRFLRVVVYLFLATAMVLAHLGPLAGAGHMAKVMGEVLGLIFVCGYLVMMGWFAESTGVGLLAAWGLVGICVLPWVLALPVLSRCIPSAVIFSLSSTALFLAPMFPITLLWLSMPWNWTVGLAPFDAGLVTVILHGFMVKPDARIEAYEPYVYVVGLVYTCGLIVLLGPVLHRLWASPR